MESQALPAAVLATQLIATLAMLGIIWYVQIVHYPLFARVPVAVFAAFEAEHQRRTTRIVAPLMLAEGASAVGLWMLASTAWQQAGASVGLVLLAVAWASTFLWQVPLHTQLAQGFDPAIHRRLVQSNWLRTTVWSLRGALVVGLAIG